MRVTIVGTGNMARAIGSRALAGGHYVDYIDTHVGKAHELADEMICDGHRRLGPTAPRGRSWCWPFCTEAPHVVRGYAVSSAGTMIDDLTNPVDLTRVEPLDRDWMDRAAPCGRSTPARCSGPGNPRPPRCLTWRSRPGGRPTSPRHSR